MSFDFICDLNSTQSDSKQYYLISVQMLAKLHKLVQHSEWYKTTYWAFLLKSEVMSGIE